MTTLEEFDCIIKECEDLFLKKTTDYGTAWRILRLPSLTDQLFIKAKRLRSIEDKGKQLVADNIRDEYIGLVNYSLIALMQMELTEDYSLELSVSEVKTRYRKQVEIIRQLLEAKNHDYGEAWRDMRISSFTDLMLMKLIRIKQIEDNQGKTIVSEGVAAGYMDILNYSVFALLQLGIKED